MHAPLTVQCTVYIAGGARKARKDDSWETLWPST